MFSMRIWPLQNMSSGFPYRQRLTNFRLSIKIAMLEKNCVAYVVLQKFHQLYHGLLHYGMNTGFRPRFPIWRFSFK